MKQLTRIEAGNEYSNYCGALKQGMTPMTFEQYCKIHGIVIIAY